MLSPTTICNRREIINESNSQSRQAALGSCNCGTTLAEARAMGCKYDSLAAAWLPAQCRDEQLTVEFENLGDGPHGSWRYWTDSNHTLEISPGEIGNHVDDYSFRFYSTAEWHIAHCFFYWRKQFRSQFNGVLVEPRYDSEKHINHCGSLFLARSSKGVMSGIRLESDYL